MAAGGLRRRWETGESGRFALCPVEGRGCEPPQAIMAAATARCRTSKGGSSSKTDRERGKEGQGEGKRSGLGGCLPRAQTIPTIQIQS